MHENKKSNDQKRDRELAPSESYVPWNKGRALGQKTPLTKEELTHLRAFLDKEQKVRDLALLNTGIDTMLRASDLLPLKVEDVTDQMGTVIEELTIRQQKTGVGHVVALSAKTRASLQAWITVSQKSSSDYLWTSLGNRKTGRPMTRETYGVLVKSWCDLIRVDPRRYSTHSVRRSKSAAIYEQTHNLKACQLLLGHKSIASTAHYLGVEQREALDLAKGMEM